MSVDACDLLAHYVEAHNDAAVDGAAEPSELFVDGAQVEVEGARLSKLRRAAIVEAFRRHELVLWKIGALGNDVAFANYAWRQHPRLGGIIRMQRRGNRIKRLTLRPGYSRIYNLLQPEQEQAAPPSSG